LIAGDDTLEIHKPKPWHGLREFLKEYLIIVIGVLTALAAEQAVEWLRWQERAEEGRVRLITEIQHHYEVAEERLAIQPCLDHQLVGIEARVLASGPTLQPLAVDRTTPEMPEVYRVPTRSLTDSAWQSIIAEGLVSHLSQKERNLLPIHYSQFAKFSAFSTDEEPAVGALMALSQPLPMSTDVKAGLVGVIEHERLRNGMMSVLAKEMMRRIEQLGYRPADVDRRKWLRGSRALSYCKHLAAD
jgi:hypothetical protein